MPSVPAAGVPLKVAVPFVGGLSVAEATARLKDAGFKAQVAGDTNSGYGRGRVVYTSPNGTALRGDTIGLYVSTADLPLDHAHFGLLLRQTVLAAEAFHVRALEFARDIGDLNVFMDDGLIAESGPRGFFDTCTNPRTKQFLEAVL